MEQLELAAYSSHFPPIPVFGVIKEKAGEHSGTEQHESKTTDNQLYQSCLSKSKRKRLNKQRRFSTARDEACRAKSELDDTIVVFKASNRDPKQ